MTQMPVGHALQLNAMPVLDRGLTDTDIGFPHPIQDAEVSNKYP